MELPFIDDIFKEMRFAATKPVTSSVDSGRKNNSDMGSNSVMVRTELNKDRPESIVLKENFSQLRLPLGPANPQSNPVLVETLPTSDI